MSALLSASSLGHTPGGTQAALLVPLVLQHVGQGGQGARTAFMRWVRVG